CLRINAAAASAAVLGAGQGRAREALGSAGQHMEVDAAGVAPRVPQRVVRRAPGRQLLGEGVGDPGAGGGELVAIQPTAFDGSENGLFKTHGRKKDEGLRTKDEG